ncbi:uncharacterized protein MELLADRAFT_62318 [Melampsora larici-populina 98AG31]|uniref:Uncharacterized protein n=1 Tax=Melampsora larici-populina (strain 98AG31 / pathotype 3-4-7) TaxID=747676 RepID=F4RIJ0_MELLP|nr:uncharacterized protein MELLADRAFT_62318 [Melampsora larici-populina 98AG31]EGG07574.1 hypothetical protein MELLADRAFT_62318 [Melampsora larici-populina 98AG31]
MVVATLVHEHYRFINPGYLPEPHKGGLVGILCPECSTALRYFAAREDSWTIYCPQRPRNEHNWRTWRCDQFNHERALINAGAPLPIISSEKDWGPRISPFGVVLGPKPTVTTTRAKTRRATNQLAELLNPIEAKAHPFLGRPQPVPQLETPQLESLAGPCCIQYGLGPCSKHTRPAGQRRVHNLHDQPPPARLPSQLVVVPASASTSTSSAATTCTQPTPDVARPRPGGRIHQWAQSPGSLGHILGLRTVMNIHNDRRERYETAERQIANKYDEAKVVTILLWLNGDQPKVISAHFDQWPKAKLEESTLLMQACTQSLGPTWNRALCFWDDKIDSWHETMVTFPHRYPKDVKVVVVRSPHVDPGSPGLPQPKARKLIPTPALANSPETSQPKDTLVRGRSPSRPARTSPPPESDSDDEVTVVRSYLTDRADANKRASTADPENSDDSDEIEVVKSNFVTTAGARSVKRETSEDLPIFDPTDESPLVLEGEGEGDRDTVSGTTTSTCTSTSRELKRKWPGKPAMVLVSTLLAWYKQCETRPPLQAWKDVWGEEWGLAVSTVYRYRAWITKVDYDRFYGHYRKYPRATVDEARVMYKKEFQAIVNGRDASTKE